MKVSVCLATFERPDALRKTLASIICQSPPFEYEVIVCDDGSKDASATAVCLEFPTVHCCRIERYPVFRNPSYARNRAYRQALGDIILAQSDDVIHSPKAIEGLVNELHPGSFVIARVLNCVAENTKPYIDLPVFTGPDNKRPFFFLGALWRLDLYAVGGNDEEFSTPAYDDDWFADCLIRGRGLTPHYSRVEGYHQDHPRPFDTIEFVANSRAIYSNKVRAATSGAIPWLASGGPWPI